MGEPFYQDAAGLLGEMTDDPWEAMAESYAMVAFQLIAVLQKRGKVRIPKDWFELAQGFVVTMTPLADGTWAMEAVRSGEVANDTREAAARMREKWERTYMRRPGT